MGDFERQVSDAFAGLISRGRVSVQTATEADVFDNAAVTLEGCGLLVRVVRERGALSAQFASAVDAERWFSSAIVGELFEDMPESSFMDVTGAIVLDRFARFVEAHLVQLSVMFAPERFGATRAELERLERESVKRRFGM